MKGLKEFVVKYPGQISWWLFGIGLITGLIITYYLPSEKKTLLTLVSFWGSLTSFFGISIALIQIVSIKETSEVTKITIEETKNKLILGISISDVTDAISSLEQVDSNIGLKNYEIARYRLIDVRKRFFQFKNHPEFKNLIDEETVNDIIKMLNKQISSDLFEMVFNEKNIDYDNKPLMENLQTLNTVMLEFKEKIKFQTA